MADPDWDATTAWNHLMKEVFKGSDALPFFAYTVGCKDIDDFLYLGRQDFDIEFNVPTLNEQGQTVNVRETLSRVLIGKLLRAQQWFESQTVRDYGTWATLNLQVLNNFRENRTQEFPTTPGLPPTTPTTYTPIPITPSSESTKSEAMVTTFVRSIKRSTSDYPILQDASGWFS